MVSKHAKIGQNTVIRENVIVEDNVVIGDNCYLDYGCIIRSGVVLGDNSYIGPYCILGELQMDFHNNRAEQPIHTLNIGKNALIRSHTIIYGGSTFEDGLQTGHHVSIREDTKSGCNLRVGTLTDIQGDCEIGDYVNLHSNVFIPKYTKLGSYVWVFPHAVFTNDPTPPSERQIGCTVGDYSSVAAGAILTPGLTIGKNSFISAGAVVTKDLPENMFAIGHAAKIKGDASMIKNPENGEAAYPWPPRFDRYMPWAEIGFDAWEGNNK